MRFLLATNHLLGWTGSEITIATLAGVLQGAGHDVLVYAPFWSSARIDAQLLGGTRATSRLSDVPAFAPDLAYTQHHPVATSIRAVLPKCPIAHAVLGVMPYLEKPPRRDLGITGYLAISEEAAEALRVAGMDPARIRLFRNLVDDSIFNAEPAGQLRNVVCFSYKLGPEDRAALQSETQRRGLQVLNHEPKTPGHTPYDSVKALMCHGEMVVASGRGAIEAMLCGRVPLILANCGDDGLVTPENFKALMRVNFSGRHLGTKFDADRIGSEIDKYRPTYGIELRRLAREHFGTSQRRGLLLSLFEGFAAEPVPELDDAARDGIAFENEGLILQRDFATHAIEARRAAVLNPGNARAAAQLAEPKENPS